MNLVALMTTMNKELVAMKMNQEVIALMTMMNQSAKDSTKSKLFCAWFNHSVGLNIILES